WRRFRSPVALGTGLLIGAFAMFLKVAPVSVAQAESVSVVKSEPVAEVVSPSNPLLERLRNLYISGTTSFQRGQVDFQFRTFDDVAQERYYTSADLAQMGVIIRPRGSCFAELQFSGVTVPVTCLL